MFDSLLSKTFSPLGLSISAVLIFGGPSFLGAVEALAPDTKTIGDPGAFQLWLRKMHTAQAEMLQIDWRATAPIVFCNELSIGWNSKSKRCRAKKPD